MNQPGMLPPPAGPGVPSGAHPVPRFPDSRAPMRPSSRAPSTPRADQPFGCAADGDVSQPPIRSYRRECARYPCSRASLSVMPGHGTDAAGSHVLPRPGGLHRSRPASAVTFPGLVPGSGAWHGCTPGRSTVSERLGRALPLVSCAVARGQGATGPCGVLDGRSTGVTAIEEDPVGGRSGRSGARWACITMQAVRLSEWALLY
jgi:hypothetical protein